MCDADKLAASLRVQRIEVGRVVVAGHRWMDHALEDDDGFPLGQTLRLAAAADPADVHRRCSIERSRERSDCVAVPFEQPRALDLREGDPACPVLWILGDNPACETRGIAVFVVEPRLHAEFLRLVYARRDRLKPFFAEVRGGQPDASMHEESAHTHALHDPHLAAELLRLKSSVPSPERCTAIHAAG